MKRNIVIGVLVVAVIVLGVVYWPKQGRAPEGPAAATSTSGAVPGATTSTIQATATYSGGNGLTVTTTLGWKNYASSKYGITVSYPSDWQMGSEQPVVFDNFNNKYLSGDIMPPGGAEIDIVGTMAGGPVQDVIDTELMHANITSTSTISAAGVSCKEIFYGSAYAPNYPSKNIAVYCSGKTLLKIFLSYRAGDPKAASFEATFKQLLGTIQFIK